MGVHLRRTMMTAVLTLAAAGIPLPASGAEPDIEVSPVATAQGDVMRVRASIRIEAPQATVWTVLSDCAKAVGIIPHLTSCKVLQRDPAGRWDVREHVIEPPLVPRMRTIVRNDFTAPRRLTFRLVSGDMKASDGAWTLRAEGRWTHLSYDALVAPAFPAPSFLVSRSIRSDFPRMLRAIDRASRELAR